MSSVKTTLPAVITITAVIGIIGSLAYYNKDLITSQLDYYVSSMNCKSSENAEIEQLYRLSVAIDVVIKSAEKLNVVFQNLTVDEFHSKYKNEILLLSEDINFILLSLDKIHGSDALNKWRKRLVSKVQLLATKQVDRFMKGLSY